MPPTRDELLEFARQSRSLATYEAQANAIQPTDPTRARSDSRLRYITDFPLPIWDDTTRQMAQARQRQNEIGAAVQRAPALAPILSNPQTYPLVADDLGPLAGVLGAISGIGSGAAGSGQSQASQITARIIRQRPGLARYQRLIERSYEGYFDERSPGRIAARTAGGAFANTSDQAAGALEGAYDILTLRTFGAGEGFINTVSREMARRAGDVDFEPDPVRRFFSSVRQVNRQAQADNRINSGNPYVDSLLSGVQSVPLQLGAIYMAARGNPQGAIALMGGAVGGQSYGEAREAGLPPAQALVYAATQASLEAVGEAIPIFRFVQDAAQGSGFLRTLGRQLVSENIGEQFTTHSQDFVAWVAIESNRGKTLSDYFAERPQAALDTLIATTAAVGITTPVARRMVRSVERAAEAERETAATADLQRIMDAAAESKLRRESPEDFRALVEQQVGETPSDRLYIPVERVRELFQSEQEIQQDPFWSAYAPQIAEAQALGGDVVVPLAEAATYLAGTPQWAALSEHVRTSPGGMSRIEAQEAQADLTRTFAQDAPELVAEIDAAEATNEPRERVFEAMRARLEEAGYTPQAASQMATLFAERAATRAQRLGRELAGSEADAVDVRGGDSVEIDGRSYSQSSPEFQRWFGGSKVVDESGKPLVVYHGSPDARDIVSEDGSFKSASQRFGMGDEEGVHWFTSSRRAAATYADDRRAFDYQAAEPAVVPVYLSLQNPLVIDASGQRWREAQARGKTSDIIAQAQAAGHDGVIIRNVKDDYNNGPRTAAIDTYAVFGSTQIKSVNNRGTFDPNDPRILNQNERGRITFTSDGKATIDLFAGRDLSTFIHESGHLYLEELKADAALLIDTPEGRQLFADYETVKSWFARNGHPVGEDGVIPTGAHELFARGFERYALEGKAPSTGLRRAFDSFRRWLVNIYKTVRGLKAPITPEVRAVMDRLLATDAEIAAATEEQAIKLGFESADVAKMTGPEFEAYRRLAEDAKDEAFSELLNSVMASVRASRTKEYRERQAEVRAEIIEAIDEQPTFRALALLRGKENRVRLDRQFLLDTYGEDALDRLPKAVPPIYADTGTTHPDIVAEETGFASGDEMIRALMDYEATRQEMKTGGDTRSPRQAAITEATAQAMAELYGDPIADGTVEEEARAIVHNDKQGEVFAAELRALARQTGKRPTAYRVAKRWAQERIASGRVVDVASGSAIQQYLRSSAKAGRLFEQALAKGDTEEAFRQKQAQLLNNALVSASRQAKERVEVAVRRLGRLAKRKTMASVEQSYLERIHGLLEQVDLKPRSQASLDEQESYEAWALEQQKAGIDLVKEPSFAASLGTTHWSRLNVDQLIGLDEMAQQIAHLGKLKQTLLDGQKRRKYEEGREELVLSADTSGKGRKITALNDPRRSRPERVKSFIRTADAAMIKTETIVDWLDGGKSNGPWNRLFFKPLADAQSAEGDLMRTYVERINGLIKAMPRKQARDWDRSVDTPELVDRVSSDPSLHGRPMQFGKDQIVMMALNTGNAGNLQRLVDGYRWNEDGKGRDRLQAVLDRLMTKEDWDFVQSVWDALEELKAPLFEMQRRVNGVEPEAVTAEPVETPFGTYPGGYFPAVYDPTFQSQKELKDAEQMIGGGGFFRATTRASATKERAAEVRKPIKLSMSVITNHMREVIHDITHREAVQQAAKLLADGQIRTAVDRRLGPEYVKTLDAWLADVAKPGSSESVLGAFASWIGRHLHKGTTVAGLGFRASTVLVQPLGIANIVGQIGQRATAEGMTRFAAHPLRVYREVTERSGEMRDRFSTLDASIADAYKEQAKPGLRKIGPGRIMRGAFWGIGFADMMITTGGWIGAFNKGLREGMTESEATYYADKVIRTSQGAAGAKDRSGALRAPQLIRAFYPFFSYLNALYNQQRDIGRRARNVGSASDIATIAGKTWWVVIVPVMLQAALFGPGPDEDDEESWAAYLTRNAIFGNFSSIPGLGPIGNAVGNGWSYRSSSVQSLGEQVVNTVSNVKAMLDGDPDTNPRSDWIKTMFTAIGTLTKLPLGAPGAAVQFLADEDAEPEGIGDWYEGLTTGRLSED